MLSYFSDTYVFPYQSRPYSVSCYLKNTLIVAILLHLLCCSLKLNLLRCSFRELLRFQNDNNIRWQQTYCYAYHIKICFRTFSLFGFLFYQQRHTQNAHINEVTEGNIILKTQNLRKLRLESKKRGKQRQRSGRIIKSLKS